MSNFKVGQKVVYIGKGEYNGTCILPKTNEIVTIDKYSGYAYGFNCYYIKEYPVGKDGREQEIPEILLREIDDTFAEETEAMVQKYATDIEEYLETIKEQELIKTK